MSYTIQQVLQLGTIPPGAKENLVGESFKYASAGDHVIELITCLLDFQARIVALETHVANLETRVITLEHP